MTTNSQITRWKHATGHDAYGQPTFTAQPGGPWACLALAKNKTLKRGEREVVSKIKVTLFVGALPAVPAIGEGDRITLGTLGEMEVLAASQHLHPVLGGLILLCGDVPA